MNIAIIRLGAYGDIIHALPVLNRLREAYPEAEITWVVDSRYQSLLSIISEISGMMVADFKGWSKQGIPGAKKFLGFIRELRKKRFDLVFDLQGLIKSGVVSRLTGAETRVGFKAEFCRESLNALFNNLKVAPPAGNIVNSNLSQLAPFNIDCSHWRSQIVPDAKSELIVTDYFVRNRYDKGSFILGINIGGGWESKRWPVERLAGLCRRVLRETGWKIILFWAPGDKQLASVCMDGLRKNFKETAPAPQRIALAPPTDMIELAAFFKRLDLLVAVDTGPLHLAAALGIPTVALFGPTDPVRNGPLGNRNIVVHHRLDCSGCYKRDCPSPRCMESISVDEVYRSCIKLEKKINPNDSGIITKQSLSC
ncbi:MAG: glycosyltransferase family 9 protein [bacterium]